MLTRFHSVVIDVADLEIGVRDYARLLGVAPIPARDGSPVERGATFLLSNLRLELRGLAFRAEAPSSRLESQVASFVGLPRGDQPGIAGLRFVVGGSAGGHLVPGRIETATVPIELMAEVDAPASPPAVAEGDLAARVLGLDHVVVATGDPERAQRIFGEDLGIRLALDRRFVERGLRLQFFRLGGITIEVASRLPEQAADPGEDVFHGLAWSVSRIEFLHARLSAEGVGVSAIRAGHKPGTRVCSLREPVHGVPTLLIEHPPRTDW